MTRPLTLAALNRLIAKAAPHVELVRGEGYHYFVFDDGRTYESRSVMVPYTKDLPASNWVEQAEGFARETLAAAADRAEDAREPGGIVFRMAPRPH